LRRIGGIVARVLEEMLRSARSGMTTLELDAIDPICGNDACANPRVLDTHRANRASGAGFRWAD
jgi:hypothetical protein